MPAKQRAEPGTGQRIEYKSVLFLIERERTHGPSDRAVQIGQERKGIKKEGQQTHVHILVSRTEHLARFKAQQQAEQVVRKNPLKLSPATNHRVTERGAVQGGFDRSNFIRAAERQFDRQFAYERKLTESFEYSRTRQHGSQAERVAQRLAVIRAETQHREQAQRQAHQRQLERGTAQPKEEHQPTKKEQHQWRPGGLEL